MDPKDIVAEIEDVIRTAPDLYVSWGAPEHLEWIGRAKAILSRQEVGMKMEAGVHASMCMDNSVTNRAREKMFILLQSAKHSLRLELVGPMSLAVNKGMVFDYFDRLRQIIEEAERDLLFVDPYLDADFVSRYLGFVRPGVQVRLLAREKLRTLVPAATAMAKQHNMSIEVREGSGFHDRFVFLDGVRGVQSGASFKDGGAKTPTVLLELSDALPSIRKIYDDLWAVSHLAV